MAYKPALAETEALLEQAAATPASKTKLTLLQLQRTPADEQDAAD
jgi:hypothetical protein